MSQQKVEPYQVRFAYLLPEVTIGVTSNSVSPSR